LVDRHQWRSDSHGGPSIAILVLTTTSWPRIRQVTGELQAAVAAIESGGYQELFIP